VTDAPLTKTRMLLLAGSLLLAGCSQYGDTMCGSMSRNQWMLHKPTGLVGQVYWGDFGAITITFPNSKSRFTTRCGELEHLP
jgi:hypothetical protein